MDTSRIMIIAKGKPISSSVESYEFDSDANKYTIKFKSGKTYKYNAQNVSILQESISMDPQGYRIQHEGTQIDNISAINVFNDTGKEYWRIRCSSGHELEFSKDDLEIEKSVLENTEAKRIFEYLREVADNVGPNTNTEETDNAGAEDAENGSSFLAKQYEKIDFISKQTAISIFLNPDEFQINTDIDEPTLIFPFGCNESQYQAVRNALTNRISVIEGPPGTGKTQTILNIIANLVFQGKTIQVVSNNNSAIDNVIEKMADPQYGVDFIVAQLGNSERKTSFINKQTGTYPDLSSWASDEYKKPEVISKLQKRLLRLHEIFKDQNHLAELKQKLYAVQLEQKYYMDMAADKTLSISRKKLSMSELMDFWQEYQDIRKGDLKAGVLHRILRHFTLGISSEQLKKLAPADVLNMIQGLFYDAAIEEITVEITRIEDKLSRLNAIALVREFTEMSLKCFRGALEQRYGGTKERVVYEEDDLWKNPDEFLKEYPVVLSTTYTARGSLGKHAHFDYIIMDEASQVDVAAGALAISSASNAVIVGDRKQLPNVVTSKDKEALERLFQKYNIPKAYDCSENSFLKSLCILLEEKLPKVMLREHYRCHPQIIGFCNEKFYHGDLIIMTPQDDSMSALQLVATAAEDLVFNPTDQDWDKYTNLSQIESICSKILPALSGPKNKIGIIAPYKNQVDMLEKRVGEPEIDIATVHKFQGREKDIIILSTVDDTVTDFSDDPNLLNVAVSRAKKKLVVVAPDHEQPVGSNIGDLIGYIRYHNRDVQDCGIRPVFDCFYDQCAKSRRKYLEKRRHISELRNDNEIYEMILEELEHRGNEALGVICHQHMSRLFRDLSKLSEEERQFINAELPQLDFLIFNRVTKLPLLAIDVGHDQFQTKSFERTGKDELKENILKIYGIPFLRLSGNASSDKELLKNEIDRIIRPKSSYTLVIAEKRSVAISYANVFGVLNKRDKYLEGNGYLISWCCGHLVELAKPENYDKKYKKWDIKDLPIVPEQWKYQIKGEHKEQFDILKKLMNRDDVSEILCATDAGREGELIFRLVYQQAECEKPFRRIWLSSMEPTSIRKAFENPMPASDYDSLYEAARCRQLADWIVGMNATRYYSILYGKGKALSVGRVMTPTLAMIVEREKEIKSFVPQTSYTVNLNVGGVTFESRRFETEEEAIRVVHKENKNESTDYD